jgi:hypothetical protein
MAKAGCPSHVLQKLGGWETIQMVMKYAHHDVESLRQLVEAQNWHNQPRNKIRLVGGRLKTRMFTGGEGGIRTHGTLRYA